MDAGLHGVQFRRGAFHYVAVLGESAVVRVVYGPRHVQSAEGEAANLAAFTDAGLRFRIPAVLQAPFHGPCWSAQLNSFVPGDHRPLEEWTAVLEPLARVLAALAGFVPLSGGGLRPVREWCGAGNWPAVAAGITVALPRRVAKAAARVAADVLAAEERVISATGSATEPCTIPARSAPLASTPGKFRRDGNRRTRWAQGDCR